MGNVPFSRQFLFMTVILAQQFNCVWVAILRRIVQRRPAFAVLGIDKRPHWPEATIAFTRMKKAGFMSCPTIPMKPSTLEKTGHIRHYEWIGNNRGRSQNEKGNLSSVRIGRISCHRKARKRRSEKLRYRKGSLFFRTALSAGSPGRLSSA
jgi:hypothetical protein